MLKIILSKKSISGIVTIAIIIGSLINPVVKGMTENEVISKGPVSEAFLDYIQGYENGIGQTVNTYIPSPVKRSAANIISNSRLRGAGLLPTTYDLRDSGRVTVPKQQGQDGACWAFAATGSLESNILSLNTLQPAKDYSENHMRYAMSNESGNIYGFTRTIESGGNPQMATAYYTRWDGPVEEASDPYSDLATPRPISDTFNTVTKPVVRHVQDVIEIPNPDSTQESRAANQNFIKECVVNYGAVVSSMFTDMSYFNNQTSAQNSYYYPASAISDVPNHNILIVGWDDNYAVNNFNQQHRPASKGAFIVKNSWGTNWGDGGYFYMSYEDKFIGLDSTVYYNAEETDNYQHIYQYDSLGKTATIGYGTLNAGYANVFSRKSVDEKLSAVGFYSSEQNMSYEIWVNTTGSTFADSVKVKAGTIAMPGYYTINLDLPIDITGTKFIVAVKLTAPDGGESVHPIPIEAPIAGYSDNAKSNIDESYVSSSGVGNSSMGLWTELTSLPGFENCNTCIKAYTNDNSKQPAVNLGSTSGFAILAGETITNTGATTINGDAGGDVGLYPGSAFTGQTDVTMSGIVHISDSAAILAKNDLINAYNDAAGRTPVTRISSELGGTTLTPGIYDSADGTFQITGTLTLDAQGDPDGVFVFKTETTLTTMSGSNINIVNNARYCRIFWKVGSSATLGTNSHFTGHILALTSIIAETGASIQGQLLARNGSVTLDTNIITNGICGELLPTAAPTATASPTATPTATASPTATATATPTATPTATASPTATPTATASPTATATATPSATVTAAATATPTATVTASATATPTTTPTPVPTATPVITLISFPDVGNGNFDWAQSSIEFLAGIGVINGIMGDDGILYYMPQETVTRSQFCKLIVKSYGFVQEGDAAIFPDVDESHWAKNDIAIASSLGIVRGYEDGTFRPDAVIIREELCVMISRAMKKISVGVPVIEEEINTLLDVFNDRNNIDDWAKSDVAFAVKNEIVKGNPDGNGFSFYPLNTATRAETAVIIKRAYDKKLKS